MSKIIFLNGCSSAGKSSIVKAIQHLSEEFWLTVGIDVSFTLMPAKYVDFGSKASQGIKFIPSVDEEGFPIIDIESGIYGKKVSKSISEIYKKLADDGYNLVIDEIIWEKKSLEDHSLILKDHQIYFVNVICDLALMEEREILRGDRSWGSARNQYNKMKNLVWKYHLEIDTSKTGSFANAKKILELVKSK